MKVQIVAALVAVVIAAGAWLMLASMALVGAFGFWTVYPWPGRAWMWLRYAIEAPPNAIVHRWLWITGIVALLPVLALSAIVVRVWLRKEANALYGKTGWAKPEQMQQRGIQLSQDPF